MSPGRPARAWRSRLGLGCGSVALSVALLLGLEGALRLFGVGDASASASRLRYQQFEPPMLRPTRRGDGAPVLATADPRLPYQIVAREKAPDALRVFVFGGSAAAGLGYSPNATFARGLEEMLAEALPGRPIELVNLGVVAFSSRQVRALVEEVAREHRPDLLVVYSGNNEFLEIHAAKYDALDAGFGTRVRERVLDTNLARAFQRVATRGRRPVELGAAAEDAVRLSEAELIEKVELSEAEIEAVIDEYEANLAAMVAAARAQGVPILLMAVASNWEWRGRSDLPEGWIDELAADAPPEERPRAALAELDRRLESAGKERHELLFRRATLRRELGDLDGARADFRAATNADPHLRRALDAMNARVERVAQGEGARFVDTVSFLSSEAEHGIVGFDELYDYVHFTPRGALLVAAELYRALRAQGFVPAGAEFDPDAFVRARLDALASWSEDPLEVGLWLGFCSDRALLADRDLWKYDRALERLDALLERDPTDFRALVYRGNARSFRLDGAAAAAADYRAALALEPAHPTVEANLHALLAERPPVE